MINSSMAGCIQVHSFLLYKTYFPSLYIFCNALKYCFPCRFSVPVKHNSPVLDLLHVTHCLLKRWHTLYDRMSASYAHSQRPKPVLLLFIYFWTLHNVLFPQQNYKNSPHLLCTLRDFQLLSKSSTHSPEDSRNIVRPTAPSSGM